MQSFVDHMIARFALLQALPAELVYFAFQVLFCLVILLGFVSPFGALVVFAERRVAGRIQSRVGPNRVGPQGILQSIADGIKGILKEDIIPIGADSILFRLGPYLVFLGMFLAFVALPFSSQWVIADLELGVFYLLAVESLVVIGIVMSGWASNSKWSLLGGMRGAAQIISYEVPVTLTVLLVVLMNGTMSVQRIVMEQGMWPWQWNIFQTPFTFVAFFILFIGQLAEGNRTPFDIPEAESELVSGYNTEYSGFRFMIFFLAEFTNLYLIGAFGSLLFLGGWNADPLVAALGLEQSWVRNLAELAVLQVKALSIVFVIIQVRWTLPRVRIDQLMSLCWKYLVPACFVNLIVMSVWPILMPEGPARVVAYLVTAGGFALLGCFFWRVVYHLKFTKADIRLNPLI
jgi:NADH-quinone oxidoreductase subunit H